MCAQDNDEDMGRIKQRLWLVGLLALNLSVGSQAQAFSKNADFLSRAPHQTGLAQLETGADEANRLFSQVVGLGNVYNTLSQYERAIAFQKEALEIYQEADIQATLFG